MRNSQEEIFRDVSQRQIVQMINEDVTACPFVQILCQFQECQSPAGAILGLISPQQNNYLRFHCKNIEMHDL